MKTRYYIMLFLFLIGGMIGYTTSESNKKSKIIDLIHAYADSVGVARAQLLLIDHPIKSVEESGKPSFKEFNNSLRKKEPIQKRMWTYQWKVDSLNIELKKY